MTNRKILFLSYVFYPNIGGVEVNSEIFANEFYMKGYRVRLVTNTAEEGDKHFPFPVIRNPNILKLIKLHSWADVVFEHQPSLRLSWPKIFFKSKSVIVLCGRVSRSDGTVAIQDIVKRQVLKKANAVVAVSAAIRDSYFPKAKVLSNPYRQDVFKNLNKERKAMSFVFLGRLVSEKGVHLAIDSMKQINELILPSQEKPTFKIIGDGPELKNLKDQVQRNDLGSQVSFEGRQTGEALVEILNECKYLLVPTHKEAFGNVALEGMACGCLPIVSDSGGLPVAVGQAGVLFKCGSSESLTAEIMRIINDSNLEASYRSKMAAHLKRHHTDYIAQKYLDIIEAAYV